MIYLFGLAVVFRNNMDIATRFFVDGTAVWVWALGLSALVVGDEAEKMVGALAFMAASIFLFVRVVQKYNAYARESAMQARDEQAVPLVNLEGTTPRIVQSTQVELQ